ncbi:velvet factor-domain-containing protein [Fusarium oxysporum]|nr:velvet factor-domain-containing protein [Fusarium oxysporum]
MSSRRIMANQPKSGSESDTTARLLLMACPATWVTAQHGNDVPVMLQMDHYYAIARWRTRPLSVGSRGTPFFGEDEYNEEGSFFCFPDLSCRSPGSFRLKFSLNRIGPARAREVRHFPVLAEDDSDIFTVCTAKDFPGRQASTGLVQHLKE